MGATVAKATTMHRSRGIGGRRQVMKMPRALLVAALLAACAAAWSQEVKMDPRVAYAPDIVGEGRLFMIAIKAPPGAPAIAVTVPPEVKLLDQTKLPTTAEMRRYYFRSLKASPGVQIRFAHPEGEVTVPLTIWSFADLFSFRKLKDVQLPRRWPLGERLPELKEKQTITTEAQRQALKGRGGPTQFLEMADDAIWAMQPDSTIPRWHWVNVAKGCPVHGAQIYEKQAYYPWIKDTTFPWPWKIECPVGHEKYPSNDFGNDDFTSGAFPDDGIGGGFVKADGEHYGFLAELSQRYCHQMLEVAPACADGYLATGDIRYVHKALVAMSRVAVEYAYLATMTQHRHRNDWSQVIRFGQGRYDEGPILGGTGLTVYSIDQPGYQVSWAEAYDRIWPVIDQDKEIILFLQGKGFTDIKTAEDVRRFLEENLMATWMQAAIDGATNSNDPYHQWGAAKMAEMLNYRRGNEFMDWLYDGGGDMRIFVPNTYFRDGAPYESTGGYNGMHVTALGPIVEAVEHLRELRPEVYPESKYPPLSKSLRYRNVFDFSMDTVTIDRGYPWVGDTGGWPSFRKEAKIAFQNGGTGAFEHAYKLFKDPKFAWALAKTPGWKPSEDFPYTKEQVEAAAAKWPDDWNDASSIQDGYGLAILRGGKGDDKRALWMNYGHNRGHSQDDTLDLGLQAYQGYFLSHMGYPRNWGYWEYSWTSHHLARMFPYHDMVGQAQLFADAGVAHVAEARAEAHNEYDSAGRQAAPPADYWQRRTLALVDVSPDQFYCVDLYRISGGQEHWWAFHCQEGEVTTGGLQLQAQGQGTLAGPDVPYGDAAWMKANDCDLSETYGWRGLKMAFAHLYNVQKAPSQGPWWADWKLKTGNGLHLRLTVPSSEGVDVNLCDGTSPAGGNPYEMKWLMLHKQGQEALKTQVMTVMEPYLNERFIQDIQPLALSGADEPGYQAGACVVKLADATDYVVASTDPAVKRVAGDLSFSGRFGLYREHNGQPLAMSLVGGTELRKGRFGIRLAEPEFRAKITAVDHQTQTVTLSACPLAPDAIVGATIFITSPGRRLAYKVLGAKPVGQGCELHLNMDARIGTGHVTGAADYQVQTGTPFVLQSYGYYQGARLVSADGKAEYRLVEVRGGAAAMIDRQAHPEAKADKLAAEFPKGSWFEVYDYGVGDEVVWPYAVSVKRTSANVYQVTAPVPVTLDLPDGATTK
jgi:oligo-alginate lyase